MTRKCRLVCYGEEPTHCPCRNLAIAVIVRCVRDARYEATTPWGEAQAARAALKDPKPELEYSLGWWLSQLVEDPIAAAKVLSDAIEAGTIPDFHKHSKNIFFTRLMSQKMRVSCKLKAL